jgi:hypothetical protein
MRTIIDISVFIIGTINRAIPLLLVPVGTILVVTFSVFTCLLSIGRYHCCPQGYHPRSNIFCTDMFIIRKCYYEDGTPGDNSGIALLIITMSIQKMLLRGWYPREQQWYRPIDNNHVSTENVTTRMVPPGTAVVSPY